jgi:N-acyl-D-aspartate/D-glutamate deacylase
MACRPIVTQLTMANPTPFLAFPSFRRVLAVSLDERSAIYRDQSWRDSARPEAEARWGDRWSKLRVKESRRHPDLIDGPSLAELAAAREVPPFDLLLDLSLDEGLETRFELHASNDDEDEVADLLADPRTVLGLSDAGAHVRELCDACYPTYLLGVWVRDRGVLSWEQAVWRMTGHPARVFRIPGKGRVAPGFDADLVAFDPEAVGPTVPERVRDLPGDADRLVVRSRGVEHIWVNGQATRRDGVDVAATYPGRVIRPTG